MAGETFACEKKPPKRGVNDVSYAEVWHFGTPLGVWGGSCMCPDGRVYTAGDEGNLCGSIACKHGHMIGGCNQIQGLWAFREVHCAKPTLPSS